MNKQVLEEIKPYFQNEWTWSNPIEEYIARKWLSPNMPKFLYYDEYYTLPSEIDIIQLQNANLDSRDLKTAKALFDLANISIDELLKSDNYEDYKAELESTQASISKELFKYWKTNTNLSIEFDIQRETKNQNILKHILQVRVKNIRAGVTLPLRNRSKGFNWFFSFLVWFKKIQEDPNSNYILLLDEPGLNLHAMAQDNLLQFIEDLSQTYQLIYTTHSPFMIDSHGLNKVHTIEETENGSLISENIEVSSDPSTIFPLQAAIGYQLAQNLFISEYNLLVEGSSELVYLQCVSNLLLKNNKTGLDKNITIVPVGGADKVTTFISLLKGNQLNFVCLLDTIKEAKTRDRLNHLEQKKILKSNTLLFCHDFVNLEYADIEDLFDKEDYIKLFNSCSSGTHKEILPKKIEDDDPIIQQINQMISSERFNHYQVAQWLASNPNKIEFSPTTLNQFEKAFKKINSLLITE